MLVGGQDCWCRYLAWKQFSISFNQGASNFSGKVFCHWEREKMTNLPLQSKPCRMSRGCCLGKLLESHEAEEEDKREKGNFSPLQQLWASAEGKGLPSSLSCTSPALRRISTILLKAHRSAFNYFEHWNVCWGSPDCFQLFLPQLTSFVKNWSLRTISWPLYKISFKPRNLAQTQKATWILRIELLHSFLCGFCLDLTSYLMVSWYFWICVLDYSS